MPPWQTTSYTLDCPRDLWVEYKEAKSANHNLNDALVMDTATRVLDEREDELDEDVHELIEGILDE